MARELKVAAAQMGPINEAGVENGLELIGGSCIVGPLGQVLATAATQSTMRASAEGEASPQRRAS